MNRKEIQQLSEDTQQLVTDLWLYRAKLREAIKFLENLAETHRYNGGRKIREFINTLKERE